MMNWKKWMALALAGVMVCALAACGGSASSSAVAKDYAQIIHNARTEEYNEAYSILSPDKTGKGTYAAIDGYASDMDADALASQADMMFQMLNLAPEDVQDYAFSISLMNVKSYAIAIVKPAEGKADAVKQGLETYIETQKINMETYLPDQYEVANNAKIVVAASGEVLLVCCEDSDAVLSSIEDALKA